MKIDNYLKQDDNSFFTKKAEIRMLNYCCSKVIPYFHVGRFYILSLIRRKQYGFKDN